MLAKNAITMDAATLYRREESVIGTEQRMLIKNAVLTGAITLLRREENVSGMVQSIQHAVMRDATTKSLEEVCALGMGQSARSTLAAVKVAQTTHRREVFALGMGRSTKDVVMKDAPARL